jgi:carotenoid cleavage dioxygenase-like enzyme
MTDLADATGATPWHLAGNYAPVTEEVDATDLQVEGRIPPELSGTYVRNGFNPNKGWSPHWFFGHGMLHAVQLDDGRAIAYRNRYVRTPYWDDDGSDLRSLIDPTRSPANTHVVRHAGQWLALEEQHKPYALDDSLTTVGLQDYDGAITGSFSAHPLTCPDTGELRGYGYHLVKRPYVTYYRIAPDGTVLAAEPIDLPNPVMMHAFSITRDHTIFMDLPVRFGLDRAMNGEEPFFFDRDAGARIGVLPREGTDRDVIWAEIEPCYVYHPVNAHDEGDNTVMTVCRMPHTMQGGFGDLEAQPSLWRWTIDRTTGTAREEQLDDRIADFPRVDDRLTGLAARFGYAVQLAAEDGHGCDVYKYDLTDGSVEVHRTPVGMRVSEPVFAPRTPDAAEDDGWVLLYAHDEQRGRTELRIIDARDVTGEPVARVFLPQRVPYGAHGSWAPGVTLG